MFKKHGWLLPVKQCRCTYCLAACLDCLRPTMHLTGLVLKPSE